MKRSGGLSGSSPDPPDPQTREEWQTAVNAAIAARAIADCKMYGLLEGGPEIDVARCDDIIERGAQLGVSPSRSALDLAVAMVREINDEAAMNPASIRGARH